MRHALVSLLLLALLSACGKVGPPVRSRPAPTAPVSEAPAPEAPEPDDADEQRYRLEMLDLAAVAHDPFDRLQYEPGHFTASGFVIHPAGDRVLLIHHAKIGAWLQPGGHIDPGDLSPLAASHSRTVLSRELDAMRDPSGLNVTA